MTLVITSELDDLRPSGDKLVTQLRDAGVDTTAYLATGMPHGHLNRTPSLPEVNRTLQTMAKAILERTRAIPPDERTS